MRKTLFIIVFMLIAYPVLCGELLFAKCAILKKNLDISIPCLSIEETYLWVDLEYVGQDNKGHLLWRLKDYGLKDVSTSGFEETFGGEGYDLGFEVKQTSDNGYIVVGQTNSYGSGSGDMYLIKTDDSGNKQWQNTFGGKQSDEGRSVEQTSDGGYIVAGSLRLTQVFLVKTDVSGSKIWSQTFGGRYEDSGYAVVTPSDEAYALAGIKSVYDNPQVHKEFYLIKTDAMGKKTWNKTYGGYGLDDAQDMEKTSDGGYVLVGGTNRIGKGGSDVYVIKTDDSGNKQWQNTFGGEADDFGISIQQTSDGGYIITGYTYSFGKGGKDVYLVKADSQGKILWQKTFGGEKNDHGFAVQQTSDGGYIIVGRTQSFGAGNDDVYLVKADASGERMWWKTFGGSSHDEGRSVQQTSDGGYIITGWTKSYGAGSEDVYLIKTDAKGNIE